MEIEIIKNNIHEIRGTKVILDFELAKLYEVETRVLKQAIRRNIERFPEDFMFEVTSEEMKNLTSQFVMSSWEELDINPLRSQNREWPCYPVYSKVKKRFKSTSPSCAPLC
jgi:hypothetical protein